MDIMGVMNVNLVENKNGVVTDQVESNVSINCLKDDCLAKIFSYLSIHQILEMNQVCTKWSRARDLTWYSIKKLEIKKNTFEGQKLTRSLILTILLNCGRFLNHLIINPSNSNILNMPLIIFISENCLNITRLELTLDIKKFNKDFIKNAFTKMKKLKVIKITEFWGFWGFGNPGISGIYNLIFQSLPDDIEEITVEAAGVPITQEYPFSLEKFNCLRSLKLRKWELDDNALRQIAKKKTLLHLELESCKLFGDSLLLTDLHNLEYLNLTLTKNINAKLITNAGHDWKYLRHLEVNEPGLELNGLEKFENLEILNLVNVRTVDKTTIELISRGCKKIKRINLNGCYHLSASSDLNDLKLCKNLEHLSLKSVRDIDKKFVENITIGCKNLRFLDMNNSKLSEGIFRVLAKGLKNLERLRISYNDSVDGNDLVSISSMKKLKVLECNCCKQVTDKGIKYVLQKCCDLTFLDVWGAGVTLTTLINALDETKKRINNVQLIIAVSDDIAKSFKSLDKSSSLMKIKTYW